MAATQHFRSALNGFNRQDVVNYLEYLNNKHTAQVTQLQSQLQAALDAKPAVPSEDLQAQLTAALDRCAQLEEQLCAAEAAQQDYKADELEAYRRAERAERLARDRAQQIYAQANAALADATLKTDEVSQQISEHLQACQDCLQEAKESFQQTTAALYAIRPEEE